MANDMWWGTAHVNAPSTFDQQTGAVLDIARQKKKKQQQAAAAATASNNTTSSTTTSSSTTTAEQTAAEKAKKAKAAKAARIKRQQEARAAAAEAKFNRYNPLSTPFKSPSQLRAEAEQYANISAPAEADIRNQYAAEQAGIAGQTGALSARLQDIYNQQAAGMAGLGGTYAQLAARQDAANAAGAAAAGAGVPTNPTATPIVADRYANTLLAGSGYAPAANLTGAGLEATSRANLTKALVARSGQISETAAKYLKALNDEQYQKANAIETARQNAALLGLKQDTLASTNAYNAARIGVQQTANNIRYANLQRQIAADQLKYGAQSTKTLANAKKSILSDPQSFVAPVKKPTANREYIATIHSNLTGDKQIKVYAPNAAAAQSIAAQSGTVVGSVVDNGQQYIQSAPTRSEVVSALVKQLVDASNGSWTPAQARKWIAKNVPIISTLQG